jgi:hypothetical protein
MVYLTGKIAPETSFDAVFRTPPEPSFTGRDRMIRLFLEGGFGTERMGRLRCVTTRANGLPAVAVYARRESEPSWRTLAIDLLRTEEGSIAEVVSFGPDVFPAFGLRRELEDMPVDGGRVERERVASSSAWDERHRGRIIRGVVDPGGHRQKRPALGAQRDPCGADGGPGEEAQDAVDLDARAPGDRLVAPEGGEVLGGEAERAAGAGGARRQQRDVRGTRREPAPSAPSRARTTSRSVSDAPGASVKALSAEGCESPRGVKATRPCAVASSDGFSTRSIEL